MVSEFLDLVWAAGPTIICPRTWCPNSGTSSAPAPAVEPVPKGPLCTSSALAAQVLGLCQELCARPDSTQLDRTGRAQALLPAEARKALGFSLAAAWLREQGMETGGREAGRKPPFLCCLLIIGSPEPAWDTRASWVRKWCTMLPFQGDTA